MHHTAPVPASTALAAGETCRGKAATIVGTGDEIVGTPGDDVIVTGPSTQVDAGAGHDLICLTGPGTELRTPHIGAGEGDDLVDSTGTLRSAYVTLDDGRDRYVGGRAGDRVYANDFDDTITLGGGDDYFTAQDWRTGHPSSSGRTTAATARTGSRPSPATSPCAWTSRRVAPTSTACRRPSSADSATPR